MKTVVTLERWPQSADWARVYHLALITMGMDRDKVPDQRWKERILDAGDSPITTLMFTIRLEEIPYCNSVHLVRHHIGVSHFVRSQRNDRQQDYDRDAARQDAPVTHILDVNAPELIHMAHQRLCGNADERTRAIMRAIVDAVVEKCPEFESVLVPECIFRGGKCHKMKGCGFLK